MSSSTPSGSGAGSTTGSAGSGNTPPR
jgi:hypothetical protein